MVKRALLAASLILLSHSSVAACPKENQLQIAAVGDVLLHRVLQVRGMRSGFEALWLPVIPVLKAADIAYANLEGPIAPGLTADGRKLNIGSDYNPSVYTNYPLFNYPPQVANALKKSGFDVIGTANNHALDRYSLGVDSTIDSLEQQKLVFVGTRKKASDEPFYKIINKKNIKVAWFACTMDTNGIDDKHEQVSYCYKKSQQATMLAKIKEQSKSADLVVVTPHWGVQYKANPSKRQRIFAKQLFMAGADAVMGGHPHQLQPAAVIKHDGEKKLLAFSLGNFVSNQGSLANRSSGVLVMNYCKRGDKTHLASVRFVPTYMQNRQGINRMSLETLKDKTYHPSARLIRKFIPAEWLKN